MNSTTFIVEHPEFGWLAFSGNLKQENDWIKTEITSAGRNRVFISQESLGLTAVTGQMKQVDYNPETGEISVEFNENAFVEISVPILLRYLGLLFHYPEACKDKSHRSVFSLNADVCRLDYFGTNFPSVLNNKNNN